MGFLKRLFRSFIIGLVNSLFSGTHFFSIKRFLLNLCQNIEIGKTSKIVGPVCVGNCSQVKIGDGCWIGRGFSVFGDGRVEISDNCDIAPEVSFITGSHEIGSHERRAGEGISFSVKVGKGCWLGAKASLMGDIEIGDGCIIAACALVNKSTDPDKLIGGIPGKCIKELEK